MELTTTIGDLLNYASVPIVYQILLNVNWKDLNSRCRINKKTAKICRSKMFRDEYIKKHNILSLGDYEIVHDDEDEEEVTLKDSMGNQLVVGYGFLHMNDKIASEIGGVDDDNDVVVFKPKNKEGLIIEIDNFQPKILGENKNAKYFINTYNMKYLSKTNMTDSDFYDFMRKIGYSDDIERRRAKERTAKAVAKKKYAKDVLALYDKTKSSAKRRPAKVKASAKRRPAKVKATKTVPPKMHIYESSSEGSSDDSSDSLPLKVRPTKVIPKREDVYPIHYSDDSIDAYDSDFDI